MDALDHHKQQVTRFYREVWNRPDLSFVPEILAPYVSFRGSLGAVKSGHAESVNTFATSPTLSANTGATSRTSLRRPIRSWPA
jgi:hypothetical protein